MSKIKKKLSYIKWYLLLKRKFSIRKKNEGMILLIATPTHGNLGDQAIVYAETKIFNKIYPEKTILEISNYCYIYYPDIVERFVRQNDIIVIDGGGNLGTLWKKEDDKITDIIQRFSKNKILIFPQTCYYDNSDTEEQRIARNRTIYEQATDLTVMLRDRASYNLFNKLFPNTISMLVPDIVLSLKPKTEQAERNGILLCFRNDHEKCTDDKKYNEINKMLNNYTCKNFSTIVPYDVGEKNRFEELQTKWNELLGAELIICDRLHAMIFALITETPCIALDNKSSKVSGTYEWIKDISYIHFVNDINEIPDILTNIEKGKTHLNYTYPYELLYAAIVER